MTDYFTLQNTDATNLNMSDGAYRLYSFLKSMCYGDKISCYPSQKYLSKKLGKSVRTMQRYLKELVKCGYIQVKHRIGSSNIYNIMVKMVQKMTGKEQSTQAMQAQAIQAKNKNAKPSDYYKQGTKPKGNKQSKADSKFNNFDNRDYDYGEMEAMLLHLKDYDENKLLKE